MDRGDRIKPVGASRICSCDHVDKILRIKHTIKSRSTDINLLALPSKRYALNSWRESNNVLAPEMIEHLKGIVHGEYMGVNVNNCKRSIKNKPFPKKSKCSSKPKTKGDNKKCCQVNNGGKNSCSLISKLLKKINTYDLNRESSLTCIIYNELCCLMDVDVNKPKEPKQNNLILMAKKLSIWIKEMTEKKGSIHCDENALAEAKEIPLSSEIMDCTCNKEKVSRKPKAIKSKKKKNPPPPKEIPMPEKKVEKKVEKKETKEKKPKPEKEPKPEKKPKKPKEQEQPILKPEPLKVVSPKVEPPKPTEPVQSPPEPKKEPPPIISKPIEDKPPKEVKPPPEKPKEEKVIPKVIPQTLPVKEETDGSGGADKGDPKKAKIQKLCVSSKLEKCKNTGLDLLPPCSSCCADSKLNEINVINAILPKDTSFSPNEVTQFKQCAKVLHCFSVTLEVWNQWFYDTVEKAREKIAASTGNRDEIFKVDNDWSNFKNKINIETLQWKYYNQFAQKLVANMDNRCCCDPDSNQRSKLKSICASKH